MRTIAEEFASAKASADFHQQHPDKLPPSLEAYGPKHVFKSLCPPEMNGCGGYWMNGSDHDDDVLNKDMLTRCPACQLRTMTDAFWEAYDSQMSEPAQKLLSILEARQTSGVACISTADAALALGVAEHDARRLAHELWEGWWIKQPTYHRALDGGLVMIAIIQDRSLVGMTRPEVQP